MKAFSPQDVPSSPGVYIFRNAAGDVIYVGKAKSLRRRLSSYFQPSRSRRADPKLRALINSISDYEIVEVKSDAEALLLESRLIKTYHPRYNVDLRDDKRYLLIAVDPTEQYPRLTLTRIRRQDAKQYFGPFPYARALRRTVDILSRRFGLRTCSTRNPGRETYRHCLKRKIKQCCCPCLNQVSEQEYQQRLEQALDVLRGRTHKAFVAELQEEMQEYAARLRFEDAAQLRDVIENIRATCKPGMRRFDRTRLGLPPHEQEAAVHALQQALGLEHAPRHIECFDISTIGGTMTVGSLACFREGKPAVRDYRRYRIRTVQGANDVASIREVISRRFRKENNRSNRPDTPDLVVIDGGPGQLNAAIEGLAAAGADPVPMLGLAKRQEAIFLPGAPDPVVLDRHNAGLRLLQWIRDEAHRFAIDYNRRMRRKKLADSVLNEIEGIGPQRRVQLLRAFKSVKRIQKASPEELAQAVPGLGKQLARRIKDYLDAHG